MHIFIFGLLYIQFWGAIHSLVVAYYIWVAVYLYVWDPPLGHITHQNNIICLCYADDTEIYVQFKFSTKLNSKSYF